MKTKIYLSLIVVILVSLIASGTALAGGDASRFVGPSGLRNRLKYGEIKEIDSKTFTIKILDGGNYTYLVDGNTRFRIRDVDEPGFADLELGAFVIVAAKIDSEELAASFVVVMPEEFTPSNWFGIRVRGEVIDVDTDSGTLIVLNPMGEEIVFAVGSITRYMGAVSSLEDLEIGWFVGVVAGEKSDGTYTATLLASSENRHRVRYSGLVTAVDLTLGTVSLSTRGGDDVSFHVEDNTRFYSRENQIRGLSDLEVDMLAVVVVRYQADGSFLTTQIAAASAEDLPHYAVKAGGRIIEIGADYFTILSQSGEEVTFNVDSDASFKGRGVDVKSLDDLDVGMIALVGGGREEDGDTMAKLIIVIQYSSE